MGIDGDLDYPEDVARLVRIAHAQNFLVTPKEADQAWSDYSDSMAAGWMILPDKDEDCWVRMRGFLVNKTTDAMTGEHK